MIKEWERRRRGGARYVRMRMDRNVSDQGAQEEEAMGVRKSTHFTPGRVTIRNCLARARARMGDDRQDRGRYCLRSGWSLANTTW